MASGELIRCMGVAKASPSERKQCNLCKRLPRNSDDEDAAKWIPASHDCDRFTMADPAYLKRHPEGF